MMFASSIVGVAMARIILRPLAYISETANRIGSDNLAARIPVPDQEDELTELTRLLNRMFDRLEISFKQIKTFAADASHELKTPLSLIRLHGEKLLGDGDLTAAGTEAVHAQLEEVARLNKIIEELLFLSRAEARALSFEMKHQETATR